MKRSGVSTRRSTSWDDRRSVDTSASHRTATAGGRTGKSSAEAARARNEEKPFLGFSSFRAEPERKLSRRRFRLPARNFGIQGSRTTPDSLRPKTGEENHRILTNGSSSGKMPARTPCPKGKATVPATFKGGERGAVPPASFFGDDPAQRLDRTSAARQ